MSVNSDSHAYPTSTSEKPADWSSDDWATPTWLIDQLRHEFGPFDLDPCAKAATAKAPRFFTREQDGLLQPWAPARVFCNPPYSNPGAWVAKARMEVEYGAFVVMLLPATTDVGWFHDVVLPNAEVRFLRGRIQWLGWKGTPIHNPKTGSMLAIFKPTAANEVYEKKLRRHGQ